MAFADLVQFCFAGITMGATYGLVAVGFNTSGTLPVPAVVASAVEDALGVRVESMPVMPAALRRPSAG